MKGKKGTERRNEGRLIIIKLKRERETMKGVKGGSVDSVRMLRTEGTVK